MMMKTWLSTFFLVIPLIWICAQDNSILKGTEGRVAFISAAPHELIKASTSDLEGVVEPQTNNFAFQIAVNSFQGFNSPLQQIHFQENYLETGSFPTATFEGRIIDDVEWGVQGKNSVRAKGILMIHGVKQERIIRGNLTINEENVLIDVDFSVLLEDHNIRVPRIVNQKIAKEIQISVRILLQ